METMTDMNTPVPHRVTRADLTCDCYVSGLPSYIQLSLRYGAHETSCPVYIVSLDPIDREMDEEDRARFRPFADVVKSVFESPLVRIQAD